MESRSQSLKTREITIPYAIFYQSDESVMVNHGSSGRVRYDKQLYRNVSPCSGKVHESETLAGSSNGWNCQRFEVLDMLDMGYDIVDEQEK